MSRDGRRSIRDLVVVLPGILGSTLTRDGKELWGTSLGGLTGNLMSLGRRYQNLALPADIGDEDPRDGIVATALMPKAVIIPGLVSVDGYTGLLDHLTSKFSLNRTVAGKAGNLLEFPYDWRLSNRLNAQRLKDTVSPALDRWREQSGHHDAKLVLIAHSMGGLISRWFLECLGGKEITRRLITMGTPYRGSVNAALALINGVSPGIGILKVNLDEVVRSLPSVHQLLPTYSCFEDDRTSLVDLLQVDVPGLVRKPMVDALRFHATIAGSVKAGDSSYAVTALKGIAQPTAHTFRVHGGRAFASNHINGEEPFGDGTVPRSSSHPPEWSDDAQAGFFGLQHASLAADPDIHRQLFGVLTSDKLSQLKGGSDLGVSIPHLVVAGDALAIEARAQDGDRNLALRATIVGEDGVASEPQNLRPDGEGRYYLEVNGLSPQGYKVMIGPATAGRAVNPVTAITLVWGR